MGGSVNRPSSYQKAAKLFSRYPHLKKFGRKPHDKDEDELQQSNQEQLVKIHSAEERVPDYSAYTKAPLNNRDTDHVSDKSDDSLGDYVLDSSSEGDADFDRETEDYIAEKRKTKSVMIDEGKQKDEDVKKNNKHISEYLDSSLNIAIQKPKDMDSKQEVVESSNTQESESDISLIASSNSLNLRFYESGKETGKLHL